jgi:uncharacterized protein (DUF1697 family)
MAELRRACTSLGWTDVRTYIQSGNVRFHTSLAPAECESGLEAEIGRRFELSVPVIVRSHEQWTAYISGNPLEPESEREPSRVMLALSKLPPIEGSPEALGGRAGHGERIVQVGEALWIHFPQGAGRSKLSPAFLDRTVGSPVTMRNFRTVLALKE